MSEPELLSSSDPADVVGSDDGRSPRSPRVVALSTALIAVVVLAVGGWWGGDQWQRHRTSARDAHIAAVSFALLEGSFTTNASNPAEQEAAWSVILVNTSPGRVQVVSVSWGGVPVAKAAQTSLAPHESAIIDFPGVFDCATDGTTTALPLPSVRMRLRAPDGTVTEQGVPVLNRGVWDSTVFGACSQVASSVANEVFPTGDAVTQLVGRVLVVSIVLLNQGPSVSGATSVTFAADGFTAAITPSTVPPIAPGAKVTVEIRVTVSDCAVAPTGQIDGVVLSPTGGFGADTSLVRALDRLVAVSCPH